ncbi:hypothetical protein [Pseudomonas sp. CCNWLW23]|uniref:hypothetical protein n=1 Tax=Pseudomonas sp. CCNWLW23 TaxID=3126385 RepID=UPI003012FF89
MTVNQDTELARPGSSYRLQRLQRAHDAIGLAQSDVPWPPSVQDLANGFKFSWKRNSPHHNIEPNAGNRGPAALVYLSDQANNSAVESMYQKLSKAIASHALNEAFEAGMSGEELSDAIVRAQDRICVVFRRDNRFGARGPTGTNLIDVPASASPVDLSEDRS